MFRQVQFLEVHCDSCGDRVEDDDRGVELFGSIQEIVQHFGGFYDGRVYPAPTVVGVEFGVLLADGTYLCSDCKRLPHPFTAGQLLAQSCARCGRLDSSHDSAELPAADAVGQHALFSDVPIRPAVPADDVDPCVETCGRSWSFVADDLPEPPDGARLEFSFNTDLYAAHNDVASSVQAGWPPAFSWCLYGGSIPHSWQCMLRTFGPAMARAVRLHPTTTKG